jgi:hypothetical protein
MNEQPTQTFWQKQWHETKQYLKGLAWLLLVMGIGKAGVYLAHMSQ